MNNEELNKVQTLLDKYRENVQKGVFSDGQPNFTIKANSFFYDVTKRIIQETASADLYNPTVEEYINSQMHVMQSEFTPFIETHSETPWNSFSTFTQKSFEESIEALQNFTATQEEKEESVSESEHSEDISITNTKADEFEKNKLQAEILYQKIDQLLKETISVAARTGNIFAPDFQDRIEYFKSKVQTLPEEQATIFSQMLDEHSESIYTTIKQQTEKYRKQFHSATGLNLEESTIQAENIDVSEIVNEGPFIANGPELLDYFKSPDFDIYKLTEEQQTMYISEYIFGDEKALLDKLTRIAAERNPVPEPPNFSESQSPFLDDTPLQEPVDLSISPELRPLSGKELATYRANVAKANKELKDKQDKAKENENEKEDTLPEIFF